MKQKDYDILLMLHLPPPVHGSSIVGKMIKESKSIQKLFNVRFINLILSKRVNESGKFNLRKSIRVVFIWFNLLIKLIRRKPDLCYFALTTTGSGLKKDVLFIFLLRLFRVRIVYHIHNKGVMKSSENNTYHMLYQFIFNKVYVILLSEKLYFDIEDYVPKESVYICPNGIYDIEAQPSLSKKNDVPFKILFFSNLIEDKGVFALIDACSELLKRGFNFECEFVGGEGDITEQRFYTYVNSKGLTKHIKYLGKKFGEAKQLTYEQADVFVLPTKNDCFPLTILEAMQHSLPVISSNEGGIADMVENNKTGFIISRFDKGEELTEKLVCLMTNPLLRKEMGDMGRIKYENYFTFSLFEKRLSLILSELLTSIKN